MPALTKFDPTNPVPFLTEAKAQANEARARKKQAWLEATGTAVCVPIYLSGVLPWWIPFTLSIIVASAAIKDWERSIVASKSAQLALRFHKGLE